jgi:3-oxoacyl-[acyl-carrier protein] reductase
MATVGRVALVTGGTGGIDARIVSRLAREDYRVAIHYAGQPDRAEEAAASIRDAGDRAIAVGGDIADEVRMAALFDEVTAEFSGIDVVVDTAGIMLLSPLAERMVHGTRVCLPGRRPPERRQQSWRPNSPR